MPPNERLAPRNWQIEMRRRKITQKDVADHSGYAQQMVSRLFRGDPGVNLAARVRIWLTVRKLIGTIPPRPRGRVV